MSELAEGSEHAGPHARVSYVIARLDRAIRREIAEMAAPYGLTATPIPSSRSWAVSNDRPRRQTSLTISTIAARGFSRQRRSRRLSRGLLVPVLPAACQREPRRTHEDVPAGERQPRERPHPAFDTRDRAPFP